SGTAWSATRAPEPGRGHALSSSPYLSSNSTPRCCSPSRHPGPGHGARMSAEGTPPRAIPFYVTATISDGPEVLLASIDQHLTRRFPMIRRLGLIAAIPAAVAGVVLLAGQAQAAVIWTGDASAGASVFG